MAFIENRVSGAFPVSGKQPYMPKLTYRTNSIVAPDNRDSLSTTANSVSSATTSSTVPTTPRFSMSTTSSSPGLPSKEVSPTSGRFPGDALRGSLPSSIPMPPSRISGSGTKKDKKGGSFFGFLSVKEPSAQAFEEYQSQMRKKTQGNKGRPTAVGMPGVSSAKLPPTVPKVNTKWDGVPQVLKEKEKDKDKAKDSYRLSASAQSTREGTQRRPAELVRSATTRSTSSTSSGNRLAEIYGWSTPSSSSGSIAKDFALEHNKLKKTHSTTTLPETSLFATHPRLPLRSASDQPPPATQSVVDIPPVPELPFSPAPYPELPPDSYRIPELSADPAPMPELPAGPVPLRPKPQGPSLDLTAFTRRPDSLIIGSSGPRDPGTIIPPPRNPLRPPPVPELEGDLIIDYSKASVAQQSPLPSPAEWSPVTPIGPPASLSLPKESDHTEIDSDEGIKQTVVEVPNDTGEVIVISSGVSILGPPANSRRKQQSQRRAYSFRGRQGFLAGEAQELVLPESPPLPPSILKKSPSPARPPLSSYSGTPSTSKELVPGGATLRDKLGFGSASKSLSPHAPPLPEGLAHDQTEAERNITPTPESGTLRRKKGLAMFHRKEPMEPQ